MTTKFKDALEKIRSMTYFRNDRAQSSSTDNGHEAAITKVLKGSGFQKLEKECYPGLKHWMLDEWEKVDMDPVYLTDKSDTSYKRKRNVTFGDMPKGSFIEQPAGSQSFPDFLIRDFDGRFIPLEAKSLVKGGCPAWNDNYPKANAIYVFASGSYNQTTIFLGQDVINLKQIALLQQHYKDEDQRIKELNIKLTAEDTLDSGIQYYSRPKIQQAQGGRTIKGQVRIEKTNYFAHAMREQREVNALNKANK